MMININDLLNRLDGVKPAHGGNKWLAKCPAHDDRSPSLSVKLSDEGNIVMFCFAGCAFKDITAAIGTSANEYFPDKLPKPNYSGKKRKPVPRFSKSELFDLMMQESTLLLICINSLTGNQLNNPNFYKPHFSLLDLMRVIRAFGTIMAIRQEVQGG